MKGVPTKASKLFDPRTAVLREIFADEPDAFPSGEFAEESWLDVLVDVGLRNKLDRETTLQCAKKVCTVQAGDPAAGVRLIFWFFGGGGGGDVGVGVVDVVGDVDDVAVVVGGGGVSWWWHYDILFLFLFIIIIFNLWWRYWYWRLGYSKTWIGLQLFAVCSWVWPVCTTAPRHFVHVAPTFVVVSHMSTGANKRRDASTRKPAWYVTHRCDHRLTVMHPPETPERSGAENDTSRTALPVLVGYMLMPHTCKVANAPGGLHDVPMPGCINWLVGGEGGKLATKTTPDVL